MSTQIIQSSNFTVDGNFTPSVSFAKPAVVSQVNADFTVSTANSGKVHILAQATASSKTATLPAVATSAGSVFTFIWSAVADGTRTWSITSPTAVLCGPVSTQIDGGTIACINAQNHTSLQRSATAVNTGIGDRVDIYCDGTKYYIKALGQGAALGWALA